MSVPLARRTTWRTQVTELINQGPQWIDDPDR